MRYLISFSFFLLSIVLGFSQGGLETYVDNFDTKSDLWEIDHRENIYVKAKNGVLVVDYYGEEDYATVTEYEFFYPSKSFKFKAAFSHLDVVSNKSKTYGDGLVWGEDDDGNFFAFTLNNNNQYLIYKVEGGKQKKLIKDWTDSPHLKGDATFDELSIEKEGLMLVFYINGNEVQRIKQENFFGPGYGLIVEKNTKVGFDYFSVSHPPVSINLIEDANFGSKKIPLSDAINSYYHEFVPIISPDGKTLFFSRYNHPQNNGRDRLEDVWVSKQDKTTKQWTKAYPLEPLNNENENEVLSVSPDGNQLLVSGKYNSRGKYSGPGLSIANRTSYGWGTPEALKIYGFENDNSKMSACLSNDEKYLIFAANGKGSFGSTDLYVSSLMGDNTWSIPMNLGPAINTQYKEETPFLASDGKTLFFSTDGMPGYGKGDIFVTKRLDDTWRNWSDPKNLGPVVNSEEWDAYFSMPAKGDSGYVVSRHGAMGESDIFKVKVEFSARPEPVVLVKGTVYNSITKQPIEAKITYHELSSDLELGIARSNPDDGGFEIVMARGKLYSFYAEKKGFYSVREHIDEIKLVEYQEIEKNLYLTPLAPGSSIRLNNIFFVKGEGTILKESYPELDRLVGILNENETLEIEIEGHTDGLGSANGSMILSEERVMSVKNYLIERGIDKRRISGTGYGGTRPIVDNSTEENRALNRRVEVKIKKI